MNQNGHELAAVGVTPGSSSFQDETQRAWESVERMLKVILFTDIQASVSLQEGIGTTRYAELLKRHDELFAQAMDEVNGGMIVKHTGDGFLSVFNRPSDAVKAALRFQWLLGKEKWAASSVISARIGIHEGEVLAMPSGSDGPGMVGAAVNLAARVMSLATGGQILVTRSVFDASRLSVCGVMNVPEEDAHLGWEAHGAYLLKGIHEPVEIFEIGVREMAPFVKPTSGLETVRSVSAEEETMLGWRPAMALEVPKRPGWELKAKLGEGGFGEVWLARQRETREHRVFKFCFDVQRLRSFKRELALFRLIRERLGVRQDIACLHQVQLDAAPYFLESEYCEGGVLDEWLRARRKADKPLALLERLKILAQVAHALGAAHSLGIIHKDVKPTNIFMEVDAEGNVQPKLADFGIGVVVDSKAFDGLDIGFSEGFTLTADANRTGTRLYSAPEYMIGRPPSVRGDIYSLGVLLYQMVIDDYVRPLGVGWQRDLDDPLLIDDIARCVDVEPERRLGSAFELAERLETLVERRAARKREIEEEHERMRQAEELAIRKRQVRLAWTAIAFAAFIIGGLTVILLQLSESNRAAVRHTKEIEAERQLVVAQMELGRERLYVADMLAVTEEMIRRRGEGARELMNHQRPMAGQRDLRRWEWYFADSLLNNGDFSTKVSDKPLRALALSPDGTEAAVGGQSGEVSIWSTDSLKRLRTWEGEALAVQALVWPKDGGLALGLINGEIVRIDDKTMKEVTRWSAHEGEVTALHLSRADDTLISGGTDGTLHWWKGGQSKRQCQWQGPVLSVDDNDDGSQMAVVLANPTRLVMGHVDYLEKSIEKPLNRPSSPLAWRPGSAHLALAMDDLPMTTWNPAADIHEFSIEQDQSLGAASLAWSTDGNMAAMGGVDGKILLIDALRRIEPRLPAYGHRGPVTAMRWVNGRERLLSIGADGTLRAWDDLRYSAQASNIETGGHPTDIVWHPKLDQVAILLSGDEVRVLDGRTWQILWSQPMPQAAPEAPLHRGGDLSFSPDGEWLAAACPGRGWVAWHLQKGLRVSAAEQRKVQGVEWTADSKSLVIRHEEGWEIVPMTTRPGATFIGGKGRIAWAGGVTEGRTGVLRQQEGGWHFIAQEAGSGAIVNDIHLPIDLGTPTSARACLGKNLLAIGFDSGLLIWMDVDSGKISKPPLSHVGPLLAIAWHPEGDRIVSGGADGSARIFNVSQVAQTWSIATGLPSDIVCASWSADGCRLIVGAASITRVTQFDASKSLAREQKLLEVKVEKEDRLARALRVLATNPEQTFAWRDAGYALAELGDKDESSEVDLLAAALLLGQQGLTAPTEGYAGDASMIVNDWNGHLISLPLRITQACLLEKWVEVAALTRDPPPSDEAAPWHLLRRTKALEKLNRPVEAGKAGLEAWKAYQKLLSLPDETSEPTTISNEAPRTVNLKPWAMIRKSEEWTGGSGNTLQVLPDVLQQAGFAFQCNDFIQLAGNTLRLSTGRMLPRATGWIPFDGPAQRVAFLLAASSIRESGSFANHATASLFMKRQSGEVTVVPLIYGQNIWDCWNPPGGQVERAPDEAISWLGISDYTRKRRHGLAFFRFDWESSSSSDPVTAFSIVSHMRAPAPMIMAAEVLPPTNSASQ
jgi:class 3 adenylate cyclase/WD40 repeat protein/tRNA A-37 threonylcarbamoyl transferase component Bud32